MKLTKDYYPEYLKTLIKQEGKTNCLTEKCTKDLANGSRERENGRDRKNMKRHWISLEIRKL